MTTTKKEQDLLEKLSECRKNHIVTTKDRSDELKWMIRHLEYHTERLIDVSEELKIVMDLEKENPVKYNNLKNSLLTEQTHHTHCLQQILDFKDIHKTAPWLISKEDTERVVKYHENKTKKADLKSIYGKDGSAVAKGTSKTLEKAIRYKDRIQ